MPEQMRPRRILFPRRIHAIAESTQLSSHCYGRNKIPRKQEIKLTRATHDGTLCVDKIIRSHLRCIRKVVDARARCVCKSYRALRFAPRIVLSIAGGIRPENEICWLSFERFAGN